MGFLSYVGTFKFLLFSFLSCPTQLFGERRVPTCEIQLKLDLADTDLAENLDLKDTLQKIWATIFYFYYIIPLELAENLDLADKSLVTDFSAKSSFHCTMYWVTTISIW